MYSWASIFFRESTVMTNRMMSSILGMLAVTISALGAHGIRQNTSSAFHVIKRISLGGEGGYDYLTMDSDTHRLYVARANRVMVIDVEQGTLIGEVKNTPGIHGVALVPKRDRGFTSNGGDATVTVFDLKTLKEVNRIKVGKRPDAILYDAVSDRVFTCNAAGDMTAIDATKEEAVGTVALGGKPEGVVSDEKGHLYVNIETKNELVEIDVKNLTITHRWPLAPGTAPTGLAIDLKKRRLFASCHNEVMVILDADNGKVIDTPKIGKGTDGCAFDPELGLAFSSNGEGTLTVVSQNKEEHYQVAENAMTQSGARTIALDPKTHYLYLATSTPKEGQPRIFEILVVGR